MAKYGFTGAKPTDGQDYEWNEETQSWDLVE